MVLDTKFGTPEYHVPVRGSEFMIITMYGKIQSTEPVSELSCVGVTHIFDTVYCTGRAMCICPIQFLMYLYQQPCPVNRRNEARAQGLQYAL